MTIPAFGRCIPIQIARLTLAAYELSEFAPTFIHDDQTRLDEMRRGRRELIEMTGQDYGFDLMLWREYLIDHGEETGYTHPYAFDGVEQAIRRAIENPEYSHWTERAKEAG